MRANGVRLVCTLLLLAGAAAAARHAGIVRSGAQPIPGAAVTATRGSTRLSTVTGSAGAYSFDDLPAGVWTLEVRMFGFAPASRPLEQGAEPSSLEFQLELQAAPRARAATGEFAAVAPPALAGLLDEPAEEAPEPAAEESFVVSGSISGAIEQETRADAIAAFRMAQAAAAPMTAEPAPAVPGVAEGRQPRKGAVKGKLAGRLAKARARGAAFGNRMRAKRDALRGTVYASLRNSAFDARPFSFSGDRLPRPEYAQTRFGAAAGGLLQIPRLLQTERTLFFVNYSGTRARQPYSNVAAAPGAAERAGEFGDTILGRSVRLFDPAAAGQQFPGNRIPASRLNPAALGLLEFVPLPNAGGAVQNYQIVTAVPQNTDNVSVRLNHPLARRDRLDFSTALQFRNSENAQLFGFRDKASGLGLNAAAGWTHTFTPRTVANARVTLNRSHTDLTPFFAYRRDVAGELGIAGQSDDPIHWGPPNLSFTNYGDLQDGSPQRRRDQTAAVSGSLILVRGSHNLRLGGEYKRVQINLRTDTNARGTFSFSGLKTSALDARGNPVADTGFDFADFLLGLPQSSNIRFGSSSNYLRTRAWSGFVQDDWRIRANLTWNVGLRYEFFAPFEEKYGRIANLDVAPGFTGVAVVTPGQSGPYTGSFPAGLVEPDYNNFSPRAAIAWRPLPGRQTQVRAGYSVFFNGTSYNQFPTRMASQPPFARAGHATTSLARVLTLQNGFAPEPTSRITNTFAVDRYYRLPYAQTWNFTVQQNLPFGLILEAGYLGTKGTRLDVQRQPNRAAPGSPLTAEQRRQIGNAVGFTFDAAEGNSIYHAGQARVMRRLRRGLSANAQYTFARSIDNASNMGGGGNTVAQNDKDLRAERGLSSFDQRHVFSLNTMLEVRTHWTFTAAVTAAGGQPFTARVLGNLANSGGTGAVGSGRADATGAPVHDGGRFFNPAAFAIPPAGRFGNAGRNTVPGPGRFALNTSVARNFPLGDGRRRVELRLEGNNVTNTVSFSRIATVVNAIDYGLPLAALPMRHFQAMLRLRF